jgi:N-acetylmuramoyl-L-alanine amidase
MSDAAKSFRSKSYYSISYYSKIYRFKSDRPISLILMILLMFMAVVFLLTFIAYPEFNQAQAATGKVDTNVVNFRSGPGTSYVIVGRAFRGYELTILAEEGGWYKCKTNTGKIVYVRTDLVTVPGPAKDKDTASEGSAGTAITAEEGLKANAAQTPVKIKLNGEPISFPAALIAENNRILVPARTLYETLGAEVEWHAGTQTGKVTWGNTKLNVPIGSVSPTVNGSVWTIDAPARIFQQRMYIPVRFAAEALGGTAAWDPNSSTVYLTFPPADGIKAFSVQIISPTVNLRSGPGTSYDKIDTAISGETLPVISQQEGWYKVSWQGKEAWVASWVVKVIWGFNI